MVGINMMKYLANKSTSLIKTNCNYECMPVYLKNQIKIKYTFPV